MAYKGVDVRQTGDRVIFRAFLQDLAGALVTSGTATLRITRLRPDGTLDSYDFNDNTFKTTALTTATVNLTHRPSNNNTVNTGLWTYALTTVSGFSAGDLCFAHINHPSAYPSDQVREWQYGSEQGDLSVTTAGNLKSDVEQWVGATPDGLSLGKVPADLKLWKAAAPGDLVGSRVDASVGAVAANAITAAGIADGAIDAASFAPGAIDAAAVGTGAIDADALAPDAIGASELAQSAADKVWSSATRSLTDKAGFALSSGGVQAIWDALTSALTGVGSVGKFLVDFLNAVKAKTDNLPSDPAQESALEAAIATRLAAADYTAPDNVGIAAAKAAAELTRDELEGDETIDTTTDPTQFHQVVKRKGTATELIRKKLYKLDGSKVDAEADVVARRLEP